MLAIDIDWPNLINLLYMSGFICYYVIAKPIYKLIEGINVTTNLYCL